MDPFEHHNRFGFLFPQSNSMNNPLQLSFPPPTIISAQGYGAMETPQRHATMSPRAGPVSGPKQKKSPFFAIALASPDQEEVLKIPQAIPETPQKQLIPLIPSPTFTNNGTANRQSPPVSPPLSQQQSPFFRIPLEIRTEIYKLYVPSVRQPIAHVTTSLRHITVKPAYGAKEIPAILMTCKRLRDEAKKWIMGDIHLEFDDHFGITSKIIVSGLSTFAPVAVHKLTIGCGIYYEAPYTVKFVSQLIHKAKDLRTVEIERSRRISPDFFHHYTERPDRHERGWVSSWPIVSVLLSAEHLSLVRIAGWASDSVSRGLKEFLDTEPREKRKFIVVVENENSAVTEIY